MIKVRPIQPKDYRQAGQMICETTRHAFKGLYPKKLIKEFCKNNSYRKFKKKAEAVDFLVAVDQDTQKIVGTIALNENELQVFFVHPDYQGRKVGRQLYNALERIAKARNLKKIILEGSPNGQPIYEHFGFKKIKFVEKEYKGMTYIDALMEKEI
jgi:GNAT superfamily N-acetyltransferase